MYFSTFLFCFCWMEGAWDRSAAPSVVMFTFSFTAACWKSFLDPSTQRSPNFLVISGTLAAPWPPVQSQFIPQLCNTPEMVDAGVCVLNFSSWSSGFVPFWCKVGRFLTWRLDDQSWSWVRILLGYSRDTIFTSMLLLSMSDTQACWQYLWFPWSRFVLVSIFIWY